MKKTIIIPIIVIGIAVIWTFAYFGYSAFKSEPTPPPIKLNGIPEPTTEPTAIVESGESLDTPPEDIVLEAGDVSMCFTISEAKWDAFKQGFLKIHPIPLDSEMTAGQWVKKFVKDQLLRFYRAGMKQIHQESQIIDEDIFQ